MTFYWADPISNMTDNISFDHLEHQELTFQVLKVDCSRMFFDNPVNIMAPDALGPVSI